MEFVDLFKVIVLVYILVVYWIDTKYLSFLSNPLVKVFWVITIIGVFLLLDIVLGIILGIAFILSLLKLQSLPSVSRVQVLPTNGPVKQVNASTVAKVQNGLTTHTNNQDVAHHALEKYVVSDYLNKAANDGIIPDNYSKFPDPLGGYNIQGVDKDIVGYNVDIIHS